MSPSAPLRVSAVMANRNGAAHIGAAVRSVLRQTLGDLELILSDDGSSDDSVARARAAADGDRRLIILEGGAGAGPAAARNRAIDIAAGAWTAIVDSDDFIHPERFERLVAQAEADGADIIADDLLTFYEDDARAPHAHLSGPPARAPAWISAAHYIRSNTLNSRAPALGYLKPMLRRALLTGARYDETLRIAEDYDLIARLLLQGAKMRVVPDLTYFYRKHGGSISHRLSAAAIGAMQEAHARMHSADPQTQAALTARGRSLRTARAFAEMIDSLKAGRIGGALAAGAKTPSAAPLLLQPLAARLTPRRRARPAAAASKRILVLSRQRVVGATNGSARYLLAIAQAFKDAGYTLDYLGPSPKAFGRWPFFRLWPETSVFDSYHVRGGWRIGPFMLARDPRRVFQAARGVLSLGLAKLGIARGSGKAAPYAIAAAPERADLLYIARQARRPFRAILCDYAFLAPLAPYALAPDAPSLIVMHDLMSARVSDPGLEDTAPREITSLGADEELRLLAMGAAIIAIQDEEAALVRARLPDHAVISAPLAVEPAAAAQPGLDDQLLFVGSNTAPNALGLRWFLSACWPRILAARPGARLAIVGSVDRALSEVPKNALLVGVAASLAKHYRDAGVVISPLRSGSGLKIKLVEAMGAGKAIVGTSVTAQGVAAGDAMIVADEADAFADAVIVLMNDRARRTRMGEAALAMAKARFSAAACYQPLVTFVERDAARRG